MGFDEKMSIKEFREYCKKSDNNIVKKFDKTRFELICKKCKSKNTFIINTLDIEVEGGCPTCGSWLEKEGAIIIKCGDCGNAITILNGEDL